MHDTGTPGSSTGTSVLNSSISKDGQSRQFNITSSGGGGERFSNFFGTNHLDPVSNNWVYDTWIYFPASNLDHIDQIELDINNTRNDGTTNIIGTQCNFNAGFWDYTIAVSPTVSAWVHSPIPCSKTLWPTSQWNHVVISSHISGSLTCYDTLSLNGVTSNFTQGCVNSNFSIGFIPVGLIQINYQLNGDGTSMSATSYLDLTGISHY